MKNFILAVSFFIIISLLVLIFKRLGAKFSKYTFSYWEILLDIITLVSICIASGLIIQLYIYIDIDTLLTKFISGLLFFVAIPYIFVLIRKNIYTRLKYELAFDSSILYIGYYYILLILTLLIAKLVIGPIM